MRLELIIVLPQVVLVGDFLRSVGGGEATFIMASFSFIADRTSNRSRTSRMAFMNATGHLGRPIGSLLGVWLYDVGGYIPVFTSSLVLSILALIYCILLIKERIISQDSNFAENNSTNKSCKNLCSARHIVDVAQTGFKKRPYNGRFHFLVAVILYMLMRSGNLHNEYLWSRKVLGWDQDEYSIWFSARSFYHQVRYWIYFELEGN